MEHNKKLTEDQIAVYGVDQAAIDELVVAFNSPEFEVTWYLVRGAVMAVCELYSTHTVEVLLWNSDQESWTWL